MTTKKGYRIAMVEIADSEAYPANVATKGVAIAKYGGKRIVCDGRHDDHEGPTGNRHVVVEFESYEQAVACYYSPEYQEVVKLRHTASVGKFVVIEGA